MAWSIKEEKKHKAVEAFVEDLRKVYKKHGLCLRPAHSYYEGDFLEVESLDNWDYLHGVIWK